MEQIFIFILVAISIICVGFFYYMNTLNNTGENEIKKIKTNFKKETVYNEPPIEWLNKRYDLKSLPHHTPQKHKKNIIVVEQSVAYQKVFFDILKNKYNLYFFLDGIDFINYCKNTPEHELIQPHLFLLSDHCDIVSGVALYKIHQDKHPIYKNTPHIITTVNPLFYIDGNYQVIIKPFTTDYLSQLVSNNLDENIKD